MTHEQADIHGGCGLSHAAGIVGHGGGAERVHTGHDAEWGRQIFSRCEGRGGDAAIADDDGGDALGDFAGKRGVFDHGPIVMGVHIDETRGDGEAGGVDDVPRLCLRHLTHAGDL